MYKYLFILCEKNIIRDINSLFPKQNIFTVLKPKKIFTLKNYILYNII